MTATTAPLLTAGARRDVPWLAAGATFLAMLDATVANLAVPDLHADFPDASLSGLTWIVTLYAVLFAALLAPAGRLALSCRAPAGARCVCGARRATPPCPTLPR